MYQNFIISYLYDAQHVSGNTPPIIRSLKLHWQPLVFHNTVEGCWTCRWWTLSDTPPIIRSLKLHWQPLVFHTWKVVGHVVGGSCQAHYVSKFYYSILI